MDQLAIADRRQLRRKLGFWRLVSIASCSARGSRPISIPERAGWVASASHISPVSIFPASSKMIANCWSG